MVSNWSQLSPEQKIEILKGELEAANRRFESLNNNVKTAFDAFDAKHKILEDRLKALES